MAETLELLRGKIMPDFLTERYWGQGAVWCLFVEDRQSQRSLHFAIARCIFCLRLLYEELTIRWYNTKGKLNTRQIPMTVNLADLLLAYGCPKTEYLFPGRHGRGHLNPQSVSHILRDACKRVGLLGVSTHSFRRSTITAMHQSSVGLKTIQSISGHASLQNLERYIEVDERAKRDAISTLKF